MFVIVGNFRHRFPMDERPLTWVVDCFDDFKIAQKVLNELNRVSLPLLSFSCEYEETCKHIIGYSPSFASDRLQRPGI